MGNPFGDVTTEGLEQAQDRLGGGYSAKDTGIYTGKLLQFYAGESTGGAKSVTVILSGGDFGDTEYRETIYVTTGRDKGQRNWFPAKDRQGNETGKKQPMPGFSVINDFCLATVGKELKDVNFEEKIVNIYDPEHQKEMPKSVPVAVELLGQEVSVAIVKTLENKSEKDGNGGYRPIADTREVNSIEKVFNTQSKMTVAEAQNGATEAQFWEAWANKHTGVTRDKTDKSLAAGGGTAGRPGGGTPQAGQSSGGAPRTSLFGNQQK